MARRERVKYVFVDRSRKKVQGKNDYFAEWASSRRVISWMFCSCSNAFELRTCEEVKIALAPGCAPSIPLACGGAHFYVVKSQMDNEDSHTGLKILQGGNVEVRPFLRSYSRIYRHGVVDDKIIGVQGSFEVRAVREPIANHENRQFMIVGDVKNALEHIFAIDEETVLVRVEVRRTDTHGNRLIDLCAKFQFDFFGIDVR